MALGEVPRLNNKEKDQSGHPDGNMMELNRGHWAKALGS